MALELVTDFADELVGHHEQEDIGPCTGFEQVWLCHLNRVGLLLGTGKMNGKEGPKVTMPRFLPAEVLVG